MSKETPQAKAEEAPETARGKRVPGVEITFKLYKPIINCGHEDRFFIFVPVTPYLFFANKSIKVANGPKNNDSKNQFSAVLFFP
ncbi:hypothetical protein ASG97_02370 [Bacillus sp. Soil745]|nr:hypothetical protein ASG97_02370 [Bacillus sp. Soil745]